VAPWATCRQTERKSERGEAAAPALSSTGESSDLSKARVITDGKSCNKLWGELKSTLEEDDSASGG
jgi:hypothetical protein